MKYDGRVFQSETVLLDGNEFLNCSFTACTLAYEANAAFTLTNNYIAPDCRLAFGGKAADTINTLKDFCRLGEWGKKTVLNTFENIVPQARQPS